MGQHPKQHEKEKLVTAVTARLDTPDRPLCTAAVIGLLRVLADTALEMCPVSLTRTPASVVSTLAILVECGLDDDDSVNDPLAFDRVLRQTHEDLSRLETETLATKPQTRTEAIRCLWRRLRWTR